MENIFIKNPDIVVVKRDGSKVSFDKEKIITAVYKAMLSVKIGSISDAEQIADNVIQKISGNTVSIEEIQNLAM